MPLVFRRRMSARPLTKLKFRHRPRAVLDFHPTHQPGGLFNVPVFSVWNFSLVGLFLMTVPYPLTPSPRTRVQRAFSSACQCVFQKDNRMLHIFACSIPLLRDVRVLSLVVSPPFDLLPLSIIVSCPCSCSVPEASFCLLLVVVA